jgi:hypothetical protein
LGTCKNLDTTIFIAENAVQEFILISLEYYFYFTNLESNPESHKILLGHSNDQFRILIRNLTIHTGHLAVIELNPMGWARRQKRKLLGKYLTGRPRWKCEDKILCEAGRWMELAQEHVQLQVLVFV